MNTFEEIESEVRSYCRSFPVVFNKAKGAKLITKDGKEYLDFFAGAGTLNYGHNHDVLKEELVNYISEDRILHGLDMMTEAKDDFLKTFKEKILSPRNLNMKVMFPGPTGTNSVEAALKLARKVKIRTKVMAFTNAFHGMTQGALATTGNEMKRHGAGIPLTGVDFVPYDGYHGKNIDTSEMLEHYLKDAGSGYDVPAAIIVETVQGEGGVNTASGEWLKKIQNICKNHDILFIVDDIQIGCGRSGKFFSFEEFGLDPDMICLSKSLSGYGLPFAVTLFKPELDIWKPGEHNGTFRGNNFAFITAKKAFDHFWSDEAFAQDVTKKGKMARERLERIAGNSSESLKVKGRGMMLGLEFIDNHELADKLSAQCFQNGLVIETSGINDQVLKHLPSLTMTEDELNQGFDIIEKSLKEITS